MEAILEAKRHYLTLRQMKTPWPAVIALADMQKRPAPFLKFVTERPPVTLIGQIRLQETYDPVGAALQYLRDGVDAVALFTDERVYNQGMEDLLLLSRGIRDYPVLLQNYLLNEYHIAEARAAGASGVIAYPPIVDETILRRIASATTRWKMTSLIQAATPSQVRLAAAISPYVIGIGQTAPFDAAVDLPLLRDLRPLIPRYTRAMPLGWISRLEDVEAVVGLGVDAVIVDERLTRPPKVYKQLRELIGHPIL